MENGYLGGLIDMFGEPINSKPNSEVTAQNNANDESIVMEFLPLRIDAFGNSLLDKMPAYIPNTYINMKSEPNENIKLSPAKWLSQYSNVNNSAVKMPERLTMEYILSQRD